MAIDGRWFKSLSNPADTTGTVGGARSGTELLGVLGDLFEEGYSPMLGEGPYERFRKIFFLNEGPELSEAKAFFQSLTHIDQLLFAFEKVPGDTSDNVLTMPDGYTEDDFVTPVGLFEGVDTPGGGIIPANTGEVGFWIWQYIPEGLSPETGALGRLRIAGRT
jgi:hypothetical protein